MAGKPAPKKEIDFQLAAENAPVQIIYTDVNGTILYANAAAEKITGYTRDQLIGGNPRLWGQQMSKEYYAAMWRTIKDDRRRYTGEITNRRKNGEMYIADVRIAPILGKNGALRGFVSIEIDITERKRAQGEIQAQNRKLFELYAAIDELRVRDQALLESIGEGLIAVDPESKVLLINPQAERLLHIDLQRALGKHHTALYTLLDQHGKAVPPVQWPTQEVLNTGRKVTLVNCPFLLLDGTRVQLDITSSPVLVNAKLIGVIHIIRPTVRRSTLRRLFTRPRNGTPR
ncbi:MAG: PAS domain S-box protein [Patescibacteria group bacterium]|nr:PAS domain S-box protein [Patescibacteria group bacterium]